ncbi:MAG: WecB/TagA/CpsF family glycosyltransferase [Planctomycetes bacterium]|nr:WecB/TagA/CpsF family glycosyltransferase [Planctomycetota bacterium]
MITAPVRRTEVLGIPITCFVSYENAAAVIVQRIREREKTFCIAINPEKVCFARSDSTFGDVVRRGHVHICDGMGTALAVRLMQGWCIPRITGVDLFLKLAATAEQEGLSIFLLGAKPQTNDRAWAVLRARHPNLQIAGRHHGYFEDASTIVAQINASGADMLFAALGSPRQEKWLSEHLEAIQVPFCMGVGGSFDVLSGQVKRAPEFFRRTGTEFLYRLLCEPWRWRRQSVLLAFGVKVLLEAVVTRCPKALFRRR